ncbi:MAG: hypothetical protein HY912_13010 [Desulfomonile tiedjei]|uniref:Lipoprotein n=1 Tax=Desulfomonile tiedjei TaxID=2358 RepID=A0A9D6V5M9_9BACT|nr:hypothetical protein [Desulfomonile tiedjei]
MKFLPLLVFTCLLLTGCAGTAQSLKNSVPFLDSYMKGETSTGKPESTSEHASPKLPQISPSKAALMETAQLDQF